MTSLTVSELVQNVSQDFYLFCELTFGEKYITAPHIRDIVAPELERIAREGKGRLILNTPPRHSKTDTLTRYCCWRILLNPNLRVLVATYGDDLSEEIGVELRRILSAFGEYFDLKISRHTNSKTKLKFQKPNGVDYKGSFQASSYRSSITGKGFDLIILDDLIKGPEDALSPAANKKILSYYQSAIYTRLEENSDLIIISTRWSKNDITAYLLENSKENWKHIKLPSINEDGEALWPAKFTKKRLYEIKSEMGSFWWNAMYQQDPTSRDDGFIKIEWLQVIKKPLYKLTNFVRSWDRASTIKTQYNDPDYTVGLLMAKDEYNNAYILDVRRLQGTSLANQDFILRTAEEDTFNTDIVYEEEPGSSGKDVSDRYARLLAGYNFHTVKPHTNKQSRFEPFAAAAEAGNIYLVKGEWNHDYIDELSVFPSKNEHDDQVDATSLAFNYLFQSTGRDEIIVGFG